MPGLVSLYRVSNQRRKGRRFVVAGDECERGSDGLEEKVCVSDTYHPAFLDIFIV